MQFIAAIAMALVAAAPASNGAADGSAKPSAKSVPSAQPAPKGLRLDDYLRERDGEFSRMDANGDGSVSFEELTEYEARAEAARLVAYYQKLFAELDTNHDGMLSGQEFMALARPRPMAPPKGLFESLDTNRDGRISRSEFIVKMTTNFDQLDLNKDGVIDQSEIERSNQRKAAAPPTR